MKELMAERARIDAAMAQLENAKIKANAQRVEYGKFLAWKVELQRKERKQREEETQQLRERVEKKLTEVLQEHREQKKKETHAYREYAAAKVPKPRALQLSTSYDKEEEILLEAQMERARRKEEWERFRSEMGLRSAPTMSAARATGQSPTSTTKQLQQQQANNAVSKFVSATPRAPPAAEPLPSTSYQDEDSYDADLLRDKVGHMEGLVRASKHFTTSDAEQADALKDAHRKALSQTEKKQKMVEQRKELMGALFQKAKTRRMYAQSRIAADPPADYLIGTDILRYIPVDLIPGGTQFGEGSDNDSPRKAKHLTGDGTAFFMTAVDSSNADAAPPDLSSGALQPSPPEGDTSSPRHKESRRRKFDPHAWAMRSVLPGPAPELRQERIPEEETAMYEWHKVQEQHKRQPQWKSRTYSWSRREATSLPPRSMLLDPL